MNDSPSFPQNLEAEKRPRKSRIPAQVSDDTITFKRTHLYAVLLPLAFVLGLSVGYLFWGRGAPQAGPPAASAPAAANPQTAQDQPAATESQFRRYDVPVDDDPVIGPDNAAITIIEFSDFECPYCQKWNQEVYGEILRQYPDQVRLVYRDFPLTSIHPNAFPAAEAANCANEQGKFWEYHDKLFGNQYGLSTEALQTYATEVDLDLEAFGECVSDRRYQAEVQADLDYAANLGIRSTPTFFINGIPLVGAQPFEVFQEVIQKELAGEIPK